MEGWNPKTELGKKVQRGEIRDMDYIFEEGFAVKESEIIDYLLPGIDNDLILIGGTGGKGGGIKRIPAKRTGRMHKSGRRFSTTIMAAVGNKDGYVGVGLGKADGFREAAEKATRQAKLSLIPLQRGCGSWECGCSNPHSIPAKTSGTKGGVEVELRPAPKGVGLVVSDEIKKVLELGGLEDVWIRSRGPTQTRLNHVGAVFEALKKLNNYRLSDSVKEQCAVRTGSAR